jgi:hypothetical protein
MMLWLGTIYVGLKKLWKQEPIRGADKQRCTKSAVLCSFSYSQSPESTFNFSPFK